jgi:hypothetical protein
VRAACALDFGVSEVLAEVSNAINNSDVSPKGQRRAVRSDRMPSAPELASTSFPCPSLDARIGATLAAASARTGSSDSRRRASRVNQS